MYRDSLFYLNFIVLKTIIPIKVQKNCQKKIRMAKNSHSIFVHSEFFLTIIPKKTGINLEWPKMAIPYFF